MPPLLVAAARPRAKQLDLPLSTYFAVLLRNHLYARRPAAIELPSDEPSAEVRERIPFSVQPALWSDAENAAARLGGTVSLLVEALATAEILSPSPDLIVCARGPKPKLQQ